MLSFGVNNTGLAVFLDFSEAINRLGIGVVRQRYGNLFDMYEEITDVNPGEFAREVNGVNYYNPMMIFPAIHYTMGGIWVDYELSRLLSRVCSQSVSVTSLTTVLTVLVHLPSCRVLPTVISCSPIQSRTI